ncbi:MAG TPA: hypothetical protein VFT72_20175 [Opitutaceae bacterium]|nr:hypothetical protein [Opitutaceae bacterium]
MSDKRVAEQKLAKLIEELEREAAGIGTPKGQKEAAQTPLATHLQAYAAELQGLGRAKGTFTKYTQMLPKMFRRCGWKELRDVSPESFVLWRKNCGLKPKSMNDNLTCAITFFNWMKRNRLIAVNPLEGIPKVADEFEGRFRHALSPEEIDRLLEVAPTDSHSSDLTGEIRVGIPADGVLKERPAAGADFGAKTRSESTPISTPDTTMSTPEGVVSGSERSLEVVTNQFEPLAQGADAVALGHEKTAGIFPAAF